MLLAWQNRERPCVMNAPQSFVFSHFNQGLTFKEEIIRCASNRKLAQVSNYAESQSTDSKRNQLVGHSE